MYWVIAFVLGVVVGIVGLGWAFLKGLDECLNQWANR